MKPFQILAALVLSAGIASAQGASATATATVGIRAAGPSYTARALYPLSTCVVSGAALSGDAVRTFVAGGRTFRTCSVGCEQKVTADPGAYTPRLDAAVIAAQLPQYPLAVCVVSGKELGSMGDPVRLVLDETLVQLCCKGCVAKASADPAATARKVRDAAYAQQRASYPVTTCVVGGEALGADARDVMFGTTLVRLCSAGCIEHFEREPAACLAALAKARAGAAPAAGGAPAAGCGTECTTSVTGGGCCMEKAGAEPAPKASTGGCCGTPAGGAKAPVGQPEVGGGR